MLFFCSKTIQSYWWHHPALRGICKFLFSQILWNLNLVCCLLCKLKVIGWAFGYVFNRKYISIKKNVYGVFKGSLCLVHQTKSVSVHVGLPEGRPINRSIFPLSFSSSHAPPPPPLSSACVFSCGVTFQ